MLLFASLLGLVAVSATAFVGFGDEIGEEEPGDPQPRDSVADDVAGPDLLDVIAGIGDTAGEDGNDDGPLPGLGSVIVEGGASGDAITGSDAPDMIFGRDGDDTIGAGAGADEVRGGAGDDVIRGGEGSDTLHGDDGGDRLDGDAGEDRLLGHNGDDVILGGAGGDSLVGGAGDDTLRGGDGDDALHGALDDDWLHGGMGADTLFGGHGNDTVIGIVDDPGTARFDDIDDARDFLNGGGGDDVILVGRGDIVTTGSGADTVLLGDWLTADHQAEILDFSASDDMLMVFYDETGPEPDISLEPDADNPADQRLLLDGVEIARIADAAGVTLAHVALVPQAELMTIARL
ncbi:Ca2+-binding RTX toxin-like protein [Roseovarius sp. MBR-79]|jgi:Ca2+-binding RTX toxin-like protein